MKVIHNACYKAKIKNLPRLGKLVKDELQMVTSVKINSQISL